MHIILIRHGETSKDKTLNDRELTRYGIAQIKSRAKELGFILEGETIILHTPAFRAKQSASILAKILKHSETMTADLRISNIDLLADEIERSLKQGLRVAEVYLSHSDQKLQDMGIETPRHLYRRWMSIFQKYRNKNIICVSHEGSLEAFCSIQNRLKCVHKTFDKYFDYSDYIIFE